MVRIRTITRGVGGLVFGLAFPGSIAGSSLVWVALLLIGVLIVIVGEFIDQMLLDDAQSETPSMSEMDASYDALELERRRIFNADTQRRLDAEAAKARALGSLHDGQEL